METACPLSGLLLVLLHCQYFKTIGNNFWRKKKQCTSSSVSESKSCWRMLQSFTDKITVNSFRSSA